jgi:uncharacterized protein
MRTSIRSQPLWCYFGLTFLLSWALWVPMALDHFSLLPTRLDSTFVQFGRLLGTLGPAIAAILVTVLTGGKPAVSALIGQLGRWRIGWKWYAAAGLVFPGLVFIVAGLYRLLPGMALLPFQPVVAGNLLAVIIILTISVLGEEIGWRGFALPVFLQRRSALRSSLLLGTIHTIWHLPFWIVLGELENFGFGYWLISWVFVTALSVYITWLMINTGSLLMPVLFHWSLNLISVGILPITTLVPAYILFTVIAWVIALGLIYKFGTSLSKNASQSPDPLVKPAM